MANTTSNKRTITAEEILTRAHAGDRWAVQAVNGASTIARVYGGDYDANWAECRQARQQIHDLADATATVTRTEAIRLVSLVQR